MNGHGVTLTSFIVTICNVLYKPARKYFGKLLFGALMRPGTISSWSRGHAEGLVKRMYEQLTRIGLKSGAARQYKISQIHTLKTLGAKEPIFFLSTRSGQIVKWGDYSRPRDDVGATYDGERFDKNSQEERDAVKACQAKKLERWAKEDGGVSLDLSDD